MWHERISFFSANEKKEKKKKRYKKKLLKINERIYPL